MLLFDTERVWVGRFPARRDNAFVPRNLVRVKFGSVLRDAALACAVAAEGGVRHSCVVLIDEAFPDVTCRNAGVGVEHCVDVSMDPCRA